MTYNTPTPEEMVTISSLISRRKWAKGEIEVMAGIYNRIFNARERATTCGNCIKRLVDGLTKVYNLEKDK